MHQNLLIHLLYSCFFSLLVVTCIFMTSNSVTGIVHTNDLKIERMDHTYVVYLNDRTLPLDKDIYHHILKADASSFEYKYTYTLLHRKSGNLIKFSSFKDAEG